MSNALRPMTTGEVLDRTFSLYRNNFFLFTGIATSYGLCVLIGFAILVASIFLLVPGGRVRPDMVSNGLQNIFSILLAELVLVFFALIGYALASGATSYAVSRVHLGYPATIRNSYQTIRPLVWRFIRIVLSIFLRVFGALILTEFLIGVMTGISATMVGSPGASPAIVGFIIGIVGVVIFVCGAIWAVRIGCRNSIAVTACLLERLPARQALKRSQWLAKSFLGRIFLIFLLTGILSAALFYVFQVPGFLLAHVLPRAVVTALQFIVIFVALSIAFPIGAIAVSLLYYDLRVRKEAFDLQLLMEAVGQVPPEQPAAAAPIG